MEITEERQHGVVVVAPVGRIDSTTSAALDTHLTRLVGSGPERVVIDFGRVDYISSAGLRVLLGMAKRTRDTRGALALAALGDSVRQVFELAGFLPLFAIEPTRERAIQSIGTP
jgi:anti-anti-sigma factor